MMIDFTKSKQYTLSIRLSEDGFSFSVYNPLGEPHLQEPTDMEIDGSLSLTANLKRIFAQSDFAAGHAYRRVNILMAGRRFTIAPLDLFDRTQAELLFYHNHPKRENEQVMCNVLNKNGLVILFGIDRSAYSFLNEQYPEAQFYSGATPLIDYCAVKSRLGNNKKRYASVSKDATDVYCFGRGKLLLANSFGCRETEDRIYFLLNVWKQLGFDQERDELHLTGVLPDKEALTDGLKRFIRQTYITNPTHNMDLQAILTCE
jgi:hypothetical protein